MYPPNLFHQLYALFLYFPGASWEIKKGYLKSGALNKILKHFFPLLTAHAQLC